MGAGQGENTLRIQWAWLVISLVVIVTVLPLEVSAIPPLDSRFALPTDKSHPSANCTGKHCQTIHQANFDELRWIAVIKRKILQQINPGRSTKEPLPTVQQQQPEERPTAQPEFTSTSGPLSLFEDIVTFAEQPDLPNVSSDSIVKFKIGHPKGNRRLEVKSADLWILVRMKHSKSSKKKPRVRSFRKRRGRKVHLKIFTVKEANSRKSRDVKGSNGEILTEVRLRVKKSQWQRFGLPLSLIQTMLDNPEKSLSLRIDCEGCGKKVSPVLLYRQKRRTKSMRKRRRHARKRKLSKKRPLLMVLTRVKNNPDSPT